MLTLYGKGGRTFRSIWMLEEAQLSYDRVFVDWSRGESHTAEFLRINPNGKVPALKDRDAVYFESLAINYHIARTHARTHARNLWVTDDYTSAAIQWLAWGMGELEGPHDAANKLNVQIDPTRLNRSLEALRRCVGGSDEYITGDRFTVVDLNIACLLLRPQYRPVAQEDPSIANWFLRCIRRPALQRAQD